MLANDDVHCAVIGLAEIAHLQEALGVEDMDELSGTTLETIADLQQSNFATTS